MIEYGKDNPVVKGCRMKAYFEKVFEMMEETAKHSNARKQ